jgi:hypothetical protein
VGALIAAAFPAALALAVDLDWSMLLQLDWSMLLRTIGLFLVAEPITDISLILIWFS